MQLAEVGGNNSALSADVQAVEQADANKGDKSASQVVQDILGAASRNGYQWDCATNRLVAPASAGQPAAGRSVGGPGQAGAAGVGGAVVSAGGDGTSGASSTASPSGSPTSLSAQAAPASSTGGTTNIPIPVIVAGLILCSAALFAAVRRVSRH